MDNDFDISEADVLEADVYDTGDMFDTSGIFDPKPFIRTIKIPAIAQTQYFSKLDVYPVNHVELDYFIEQLDLLKLFLEFDTENVDKYSAEKLDELYIILKLIEWRTVKFCEYMIREFFEPEFGSIFREHLSMNSMYDNELSIGIFLEHFSTDIGVHVLKYLTMYLSDIQKDTTPDILYKKLAGRLQHQCKKQAYEEYYANIFMVFELEMDDDFFDANEKTFLYMAEKMAIYTKLNSYIISDLAQLYKMFVDNTPHETVIQEISRQCSICGLNDVNDLINAISDGTTIFMELIRNSDNEDKIVAEKVKPISSYPNFLYSEIVKTTNMMNVEWCCDDDLYQFNPPTLASINSWAENEKKRVGTEVEKFGLTPYKESNDILMAFVHHGFAPNSLDLINLIIYVMETFRDECGIYDKNSDNSLDMSYMLSAIGHDINESYDEFLMELYSGKLPTFYPVEFILRILSRMLNVSIYFYDKQMQLIIIDNTMDSPYVYPVYICQTYILRYYLLHAMNEEFAPLCDKPLIVGRCPPKNNQIVNTEILEV